MLEGVCLQEAKLTDMPGTADEEQIVEEDGIKTEGSG